MLCACVQVPCVSGQSSSSATTQCTSSTCQTPPGEQQHTPHTYLSDRGPVQVFSGKAGQASLPQEVLVWFTCQPVTCSPQTQGVGTQTHFVSSKHTPNTSFLSSDICRGTEQPQTCHTHPHSQKLVLGRAWGSLPWLTGLSLGTPCVYSLLLLSTVTKSTHSVHPCVPRVTVRALYRVPAYGWTSRLLGLSGPQWSSRSACQLLTLSRCCELGPNSLGVHCTVCPCRFRL
jgi:hypothetical protein